MWTKPLLGNTWLCDIDMMVQLYREKWNNIRGGEKIHKVLSEQFKNRSLELRRRHIISMEAILGKSWWDAEKK